METSIHLFCCGGHFCEFGLWLWESESRCPKWPARSGLKVRAGPGLVRSGKFYST